MTGPIVGAFVSAYSYSTAFLAISIAVAAGGLLVLYLGLQARKSAVGQVLQKAA